MNWQLEQEKAANALRLGHDTNVYRAMIEWLYAHWQDSLENLSVPAASDEDLKWKHAQAVLFRALLEEIDVGFKD